VEGGGTALTERIDRFLETVEFDPEDRGIITLDAGSCRVIRAAHRG